MTLLLLKYGLYQYIFNKIRIQVVYKCMIKKQKNKDLDRKNVKNIYYLSNSSVILSPYQRNILYFCVV